MLLKGGLQQRERQSDRPLAGGNAQKLLGAGARVRLWSCHEGKGSDYYRPDRDREQAMKESSGVAGKVIGPKMNIRFEERK
ncbi:hypothetical protein chiPu_0009931 [Chiloscyllium punctatum]|uniref:Uncharacterized protein n=1 Tax=Chiloscyllium punctatum TaxID=137246 RepID=A0A401SM67_CHIPU|nr:hypothetical protein [Chiloscyllium punctatum]